MKACFEALFTSKLFSLDKRELLSEAKRRFTLYEKLCVNFCNVLYDPLGINYRADVFNVQNRTLILKAAVFLVVCSINIVPAGRHLSVF